MMNREKSLEVFECIRQAAVSIISEEDFKEKLLSGKKLRIKLGADPSRPDLHLGHSVVLRKLRLLQDLGHEIIFVIGDFTGMIGDPSGKNKTRPPLTFEQTRENGRSYMEQVTKILDPEKTKVVYNSQWLADLRFEDVLKLAGTYTVARILERDDFSKRFHENSPIGMHELFYPLMQGYDSVALECDVEVGGSDQIFNLLVGRELQRSYGQEPQNILAFPLLPGLDGVEKMSKSLDNYIGVDEAPGIMYEKCMKVPDSLLMDYFRLTTDLPPEAYTELVSRDAREAHFLYAGEITRFYWSREEAGLARKRYCEVASGSVPEQIPTVEINGQSMDIVSLLRQVGFAASNSDARRLIQGHGVRVGDTVIESPGMIISGQEVILRKGKNKFVRIRFVPVG